MEAESGAAGVEAIDFFACPEELRADKHHRVWRLPAKP